MSDAPRKTTALSESLFAVWCLVWSVVMTSAQLFGPSRYVGDYPAHLRLVESMGRGKLEVPHFVFHALAAVSSRVVSLRLAVILVIAGLQVWLGLLVYRALRRAWATRLGDTTSASRAAFLTAVAVLTSGPISVFTFPNLFFGYLVTSTYHNPTIQTVKPFALLVFLAIVELMLDESDARPTWLQWLGFGCISLLMTLAKPSFSIIVPPALLLFLLLHAGALDWRRFLLGSAVFGLSIGVILIWQYWFLYGSDTNREGFGWAPLVVVRGFEPSLVRLAVKWVLSTLFPLSVLLTNWRTAVRDRALVFAWLCLLVSIAYYLLLIERGPRAPHGNFGWGVLITLFLLFFSSATFLARRAGSWLAPARLIPLLALAAHFGCGVLWYAASANWLGVLCLDGKGNWCW